MGIVGIINSTWDIGVKISKLRNFQEYSHSCVKRALQSKTMMAAKSLVALGILMILMTDVEGNPAQIIPIQAGDRISTRLESPTLSALPQAEERLLNGAVGIMGSGCMARCLKLYNQLFAASGIAMDEKQKKGYLIPAIGNNVFKLALKKLSKLLHNKIAILS